MPSVHRETLFLHHHILDHERDLSHSQAAVARKTLEAEQARLRSARSQHRVALASAKAQAHEYKAAWLQAKRDGARLLQFVDRHLKKAA